MILNDSFFVNDINKFSLDDKKEIKTKDAKVFEDILNSISEQENAVSEMKTQFLNGERDDIQNILIEGQKLSLEVNFALQVRNNLVNAFQQLMTMQV